MKWLFIGLVRIYQKVISPWLPNACRYTPSCSEYAILAIQKRGVIVGSIIGFYRILRCNPWGGCGDDPVPSKGLRFKAEKI
ncbi:MAG: membrane protein insertion efficiency factor YidD [Bacteroidota bacterium]|nr:membrane protein insertion efficiency factor YidD [Bacteroidota bacterium]